MKLIRPPSSSSSSCSSLSLPACRTNVSSYFLLNRVILGCVGFGLTGGTNSGTVLTICGNCADSIRFTMAGSRVSILLSVATVAFSPTGVATLVANVWSMFNPRGRDGTGSTLLGVLITMLELSELRISLFLEHSRFFCSCCSPLLDPFEGGDADEGSSLALFVPPPPPESTSESSLHCFLIRSASNSSLLILFREISFNASNTLLVGAASSSAVGAITRFSASISSSGCGPPRAIFRCGSAGISNEPARRMFDRVFAWKTDFSGGAIRTDVTELFRRGEYLISVFFKCTTGNWPGLLYRLVIDRLLLSGDCVLSWYFTRRLTNPRLWASV